ncbi:hypothetical protein GGX14DRAFT_571906 [Mycena pura]|uniref:BTB domain-containing protein n=1 Tax=Mycena pura TaxID=153505 RepID=A0AAD6Y7N2_9AGAR|nr:hypothetical protein GGX14DRAFT_571906 [Mycena pura]
MSTRVDDLWFEDGSLVIKAEEKLFRISKCLLAARSTIFKDMLSFPPVPDGEMELIDGIPVVTLSDSAKDVEVFLRAIFDSSFFMPPPEPVQLQEVVGVLRLSHKYEVGYLYRRALEHLSRRLYFPSIEAYRASKGIEEPWSITFIGSSAKPNAQEIFTIIKVCTTVGAAWLLPMAYYYACYHIRQTDLLSMTSAEDEHHSRLCLSACRDLIANNVAAFSFLKYFNFEEDCVDSRRCEKVRQGLWSLVLGAVEVPLDVAPLDSFRGNIWEQVYLEDENSTQDEDEPGAFCVPCHHASKTRHDNFLQECWNNLPSFFHLPSWSELEPARQAVFGFGESTTGEMGDLDEA